MEDQLDLFPHIQPKYKVSQVIKRNGDLVPFDRDKITNAIFKAAVEAGGSDQELAQNLTAQVLRTMNAVYPEGAAPSVEEVQDLIEKVLIENGHARTAKAFILYRAERTRIREKKDAIVQAEDNVPYKLVWKTYSWNVDHGCDTVEKLNRQIQDGGWKKLVLDSEKHYQSEIAKVARRMLESKDRVRVLVVAGPSSSGKTTTTIKIGEQLQKQGLSFVTMNLDHYFKNLDQHPKDEYGDYDFESPYAMELEMINDHLDSLLKGKSIKMPRYDFASGLRTDGVTEFKLKKGEIILIDSLHGLYSELTASVPADQKFQFYIEAICQIKNTRDEFVRWTDLRMLRRMVRDSWQRSCPPERTVGHWHYVRRSEKKYIVPYIHLADYVFNGSMGYELPVYKHFLLRSIPAIIKKYEGDPKKLDAFTRARRVEQLMESFLDFPDVDFIPKNSFLREFIGGSAYQY